MGKISGKNKKRTITIKFVLITMNRRNQKLQEMCRQYLSQLRGVAEKFGLGKFVDDTIEMNLQEKCKATEDEVKLLSRAVDDERISRHELPSLLGKSYRKCVEDDDFSKVETLKRVGIYSKVSAEIHSVE